MDKDAMRNEIALEKEFARSMRESAAEHTATAAELEAQLAEAEKPKLRHTDFGWDADGTPCGAVTVSGRDVLRMVGNRAVGDGVCTEDRHYGPTTIAFNALDDLKAMAERVTQVKANGVLFTMDSSGGINIDPAPGRSMFHVEEKAVDEFVMDIRRLVQTERTKDGRTEQG